MTESDFEKILALRKKLESVHVDPIDRYTVHRLSRYVRKSYIPVVFEGGKRIEFPEQAKRRAMDAIEEAGKIAHIMRDEMTSELIALISADDDAPISTPILEEIETPKIVIEQGLSTDASPDDLPTVL